MSPPNAREFTPALSHGFMGAAMLGLTVETIKLNFYFDVRGI